MAVWGTPNDVNNSWGINWETAKPGYTEIMLVTNNEVDLSQWLGAGKTGHKWIQFNKIPRNLIGSGNYVGTITKSWNSQNPYTTEWFLRSMTEDPFIFSTKDGQTSGTSGGHVQDCFYSEHIGAANGVLLSQGGGIRVYIK